MIFHWWPAVKFCYCVYVLRDLCYLCIYLFTTALIRRLSVNRNFVPRCCCCYFLLSLLNSDNVQQTVESKESVVQRGDRNKDPLYRGPMNPKCAWQKLCDFATWCRRQRFVVSDKEALNEQRAKPESTVLEPLSNSKG